MNNDCPHHVFRILSEKLLIKFSWPNFSSLVATDIQYQYLDVSTLQELLAIATVIMGTENRVEKGAISPLDYKVLYGEFNFLHKKIS